jgi:hypothetical protein
MRSIDPGHRCRNDRTQRLSQSAWRRFCALSLFEPSEHLHRLDDVVVKVRVVPLMVSRPTM